jgi:hypothetical protein
MSIAQKYTQTMPVLALAATGTQRTRAFPVRNRRLDAIATWTGTPTGVLSLDVSYDGGVTWKAAPGAAAEFTANGNAQPAGSASSGVYNWINVPGAIFSFSYAATSGTGTLTVAYSQGN